MDRRPVGGVSPPVGFSYKGHRISHMKHHAFTNDPDKDPDFFAQGPLRELPVKLYGVIVVYTLLPLLAYIPALGVLLPASVKEGGAERDMASDRYAVRYWAIQHAVLIAAFIAGVGLEALLLWYIPSRLVVCWLAFIFAWYPHHPADGKIGATSTPAPLSSPAPPHRAWPRLPRPPPPLPLRRRLQPAETVARDRARHDHKGSEPKPSPRSHRTHHLVNPPRRASLSRTGAGLPHAPRPDAH